MSELVMQAARRQVLDDGRHRTVSVMQLDGSRKPAYFDTGADVPFVQEAVGDVYVAQALVKAMACGVDLVLEDPISADRVHHLEVAQDILASWYPGTMHRVTVTAPTVDPTPPVPAGPRRVRGRRRPPAASPARITAACFTGGVDSFHTLLKNQSRIDALVYGVGLDVPLGETAQIARVTEMLERVGSAIDAPLLTVTTNARRILGPRVSWGALGHGAALSGMATIFSPLVDHVLVPGTHSYAAHVPWGSHPLLDPRWSTGRLQIEHDGAEATRCEKIRLIADSPLVQQNLRVCYSEFAELNCGRCMKCLRTMMTLHLLDRLDDFSTFARPLDLELFGALQMTRSNLGTQIQIDELANLADSVGGHDAARRAIATLSERHQALLAVQGGGRSPLPAG